MRLIDADALYIDYLRPTTTTGVTCQGYVSEIQINNAPTIEPKVDQSNRELEEARAFIRHLQDKIARDSGMIEGLKYAIRYHKVGGDDTREME